MRRKIFVLLVVALTAATTAVAAYADEGSNSNYAKAGDDIAAVQLPPYIIE